MERRPAARSAPKDDREELGRAQCLRAEVLEPLARAVELGKLSE
jgi:hypothetical protein